MKAQTNSKINDNGILSYRQDFLINKLERRLSYLEGQHESEEMESLKFEIEIQNDVLKSLNHLQKELDNSLKETQINLGRVENNIKNLEKEGSKINELTLEIKMSINFSKTTVEKENSSIQVIYLDFFLIFFIISSKKKQLSEINNTSK